MAVRTDRVPDNATGGVSRREALAATAEVAALFIVFIIAYTGRDTFSDGVKSGLTALSAAIGLAGAAAGAVVAGRGVRSPRGRITRIALGGVMAFLGIYTIVHVLS